MLRALLISLLFSIPASAQVFQIAGGDSTLMQGAGGAITTYLPNQTITTGAGIADGRFAFGASDQFLFRGLTVTAGDNNFGYSVDGAGGVGLTSRGISISRASVDQSFGIFGGAAGLGYNFPFFNAVGPLHAGGGIFYHKRVNRWQLSSLAAIAGTQRTLLQSASIVTGKFHFAAGGGLLAGQKTVTGLLDYRANKHLDFSGSRQDLFWHDERATVNSASALANFGAFTFHSTALTSASAGRNLAGLSAGGSYRVGFAQLQSDFYESAGQKIFSESVSENFRHWNFQQAVSMAGTQRTFSLGGGYHGNRMSFAIGHSVEFLPFANGFEQVTSISVSFHIPHTDTSVNLATTLLPTGPLFTASGSSFVQGPSKSLSTPHVSQPGRKRTGAFSIRGRVVDSSGKAVSGAAIQLGRTVVFTDSTGQFSFRARRAQCITVRVLPEEFAAPGTWQADSAPVTATPTRDSAEISIVVRRTQ